jgi:hypothetical protein
MAAPTPPPAPTPTPPSTYIVGVGGLILGGTTATFLADIGLSEHAQIAIVSFGGLLVAIGLWLHQIGH